MPVIPSLTATVAVFAFPSYPRLVGAVNVKSDAVGAAFVIVNVQAVSDRLVAAL